MRTSNIQRRTLNAEVKKGASPSSIRRSTFAFERWTFTILLLLKATGCARLPPAPIPPPSPPPNIYLLRGYLDWYSTGIDRLAAQLRADGHPAQSYREEQWGKLADWLIQSHRRPVTLIGFSYGADDVILIARRLNDAHLPVDLLITLDPVTPAPIPPNVKTNINFYEPNGFWDLFPWLRGIPVDCGQNINIRARPDLNEPDTSHTTIADNEKIHAAIRQLLNTGDDPPRGGSYPVRQLNSSAASR